MEKMRAIPTLISSSALRISNTSIYIYLDCGGFNFNLAVKPTHNPENFAI